MEGIYFIKNTYSEWDSIIKGYFPTLEDAKKALKDCSDWYRPNGTGQIYFQEFGLKKDSKLIYENR